MAKMTKRELKEQRRLENQEKLKNQKRNEMIRKIAIWAGAAIILGASVWVLIVLSNSTPNKENKITTPPISKDDITIGTESARVTLVEYSDFQCPACAAYHPIVSQLISEFEGKLLFAYRFFPLSQTHKNAMISAQAAMAAHKQGKFREMHDMLFVNQNSWANENNAEEIFIGYAREIGLDIEKFKTDLNSDGTKKFIQDQYSQGVSIGVNSTPTFFVNGQKILTPGTYADFKKLIENEINKK